MADIEIRKFEDGGIEISHIGNYQHPSGENVILVDDEAGYVKACQKLAEMVGKETLKVLVRQKFHFAWLRSFTEQIGILCRFTVKTPKIILCDMWKVPVPDWLDDETVTSQKLLDLDIPTRDFKHFEDVLLSYFFGPAFASTMLDGSNLSEVISALTRPEAKDHYSRYPVLTRCIEEKSKSWTSQASEHWIRDLCADLLSDPEKLWKELTLWSILASYPEKSLEYVVPPQRTTLLRSIPLETIKDLPINRIAVEQALAQIEIFFKEISPSVKSSGDFQKVLECTSGRLGKEFQFVTDLLASSRVEVSKTDIDLIRQKFKNCPGLDAAKLASISRFAKPLRPSIPKESECWTADRWITWAVEEYIPYRHWQTQNRCFDLELEEGIQRFSDWYVAEYTSIHQDEEKSLVQVLGWWGSSIRDETLSLVILVDSLPLTFWSLLQESLNKAGFRRHELAYRFVPLPSDTEISKPLVLRGGWESSNRSYEEILQERARNDWGNKRVVYLPSLKELLNVELNKEPAILLLNFLPSDEVLHSDVELKGSTYEEELYRLFSKITDSVKSLFERWLGQAEGFSVYVITDHGASNILEEEKKSLEAKVVNKLFANEKYRFASIEKSEAEAIPENLWVLGYRFTQPFIKDDRVYFIPRGHNTVKAKAGGSGYSHGGASPEEVIVPVAIFRAVKPSWKDLGVRFLNLKIDPHSRKAIFYIQRVFPLQIEVQNPNSEAIRILRVDVLSPDTDVKGYNTPNIEAGRYSEVTIDCYFNRSALENSELTLQLTYSVVDEERAVKLSIAADFKSVASGGFSLKDLK